MDRLFARPDKPSRCTLPITALRLTLPSSAAIWLAESPASQSFFQLLNAIMGPGQNRHFTLSSHRGGQFLEPRDDAKLQKTAPSESLKARRSDPARQCQRPATAPKCTAATTQDQTAAGTRPPSNPITDLLNRWICVVAPAWAFASLANLHKGSHKLRSRSLDEG